MLRNATTYHARRNSRKYIYTRYKRLIWKEFMRLKRKTISIDCSLHWQHNIYKDILLKFKNTGLSLKHDSSVFMLNVILQWMDQSKTLTSFTILCCATVLWPLNSSDSSKTSYIEPHPPVKANKALGISVNKSFIIRFLHVLDWWCMPSLLIL